MIDAIFVTNQGIFNEINDLDIKERRNYILGLYESVKFEDNLIDMEDFSFCRDECEKNMVLLTYLILLKNQNPKNIKYCKNMFLLFLDNSKLKVLCQRVKQINKQELMNFAEKFQKIDISKIINRNEIANRFIELIEVAIRKHGEMIIIIIE